MSPKTAALLLALAAASGAHAQGPLEPHGRLPPVAPPRTEAPPPPPKAAQEPRTAAPTRGAVLEEVSGKVREVDRKGHRLVVEVDGGVVTLSLDRNTMVYTATGLGTVLDLVPGAQVRAGRNAELLAYWVQVRQPARAGEPEPAPAPGQGTGPAGGASGPATEPRGGAPAGPGTAPPGTGGALTPAGPGGGRAP